MGGARSTSQKQPDSGATAAPRGWEAPVPAAGPGGCVSVTGSGSPNLPSPFLVRTRTLWGGTFLRPRQPPRHHHLSPAVGPDQQQGPCGLRKQLALVFGKQSKERPHCLLNTDLRKESFRVVGGGKKVQTGPRGGGAGVGGAGGMCGFQKEKVGLDSC